MENIFLTVFVIILIVLAGGLIFGLVKDAITPQVRHESVLMNKHYNPPSASTIIVNGKTSTISTPEKHILVFKENEEIVEMNVNKSVYYNIKIGDYFSYYKRWFSRSFIEILE